MRKTFEKTPAYFAAANSFNGFISNFKNIFLPEEYSRIYILKGGPGTGKSTLMKRVAEKLLDNGAKVTRIYCSSDPKSLDAVIIENNDKKTAIIDGTAPHTVDAIYPGAVETIIDLGNAFDQEGLIKNRDKIISLCKNKKHAYESAYSILKICGEIYNYILNKIKNSRIYSEAELICGRIMEYELFNEKSSNTIDKYWLGSFGKNGYVRLDIPCFEKEYISVLGDGFSENITMNILLERLSFEGLVTMIAKSAYTEKSIDAIITKSCVISTDNVGNTLFDTSVITAALDNEYHELLDKYRAFLIKSQKQFAKAAEFHFLLEDIYKSQMNFSYNDGVTQKLQDEISGIIF